MVNIDDSFLSTSTGYQYLDDLDYITQEMDDWYLVSSFIFPLALIPGPQRYLCDAGGSVVITGTISAWTVRGRYNANQTSRRGAGPFLPRALPNKRGLPTLAGVRTFRGLCSYD